MIPEGMRAVAVRPRDLRDGHNTVLTTLDGAEVRGAVTDAAQSALTVREGMAPGTRVLRSNIRAAIVIVPVVSDGE